MTASKAAIGSWCGQKKFALEVMPNGCGVFPDLDSAEKSTPVLQKQHAAFSVAC